MAGVRALAPGSIPQPLPSSSPATSIPSLKQQRSDEIHGEQPTAGEIGGEQLESGEVVRCQVDESTDVIPEEDEDRGLYFPRSFWMSTATTHSALEATVLLGEHDDRGGMAGAPVTQKPEDWTKTSKLATRRRSLLALL